MHPPENPSIAALGAPFELPCGAVLPNRIVKAAMTEQLADAERRPTDRLIRLYAAWGRGGAGMLLTGNVMVDHRSLEGPRNVVIEDDRDLPALRRWAEAAQEHGARLWMQISHPGRQTPRRVSREVVAPSAVRLRGLLAPLFPPPRALQTEEIEALIARFAATAAIAREAGFAGVQIHGAHGYLNSQFLSPLTNRRTDEWGGPLENRMRFLRRIVRETRARAGSGFPIGVKLNSADFQRGGFTEAESMEVVRMLAAEGVDLLEISGGNYENPMMVQRGETRAPARESTLLREAFFLEYAQRVRAITEMPLLLTGGLRTAATMAALVAEGHVDCVGVARPLALDPDFPRKLLAGETDAAPIGRAELGIRPFDDMLQSWWHQQQMWRIADGNVPDPRKSRLWALARGMAHTFAS